MPSAPIVHYDEDGNRTVIGSATLNATLGTFVGEIDNHAVAHALFGSLVQEFSMYTLAPLEELKKNVERSQGLEHPRKLP
jgi:hypothetical protein